ncbi:hypothetical protein FLAV_01740 [Flavobacteriales bacterium]|nr:hypothetical protein [Flavobacteriales bacterium]MCL4816968.1 DUF4190 domain-containing protein [Flavobacteriales bacterium]WKZ76028.1 MAG: CCC motif membrane protein [Vicingaceae bacterium]GIK70469.1 MAG: hypothetical protein BroJett020_17640 [Bacteroidota bacterium]CAG0980476.1 hypothetical protein FLAV_01740 [Flavobacteriales bacterium]
MEPSSQQPNPQAPPFLQLPAVPNSTAVLVLGILSIVFFCCCYGFLGLALGIIAMVLANQGFKKYNENPGAYSQGSLGNLKGGRICAIIGVILSALIFVVYLAIIIFSGTSWMYDTTYWQEILQEINK